MKDELEITLQRGEYFYNIFTRRAVTIIRESDLLALECEVFESDFPCYFVDDNWRETLLSIENSFIVVDDSTDFLDSLSDEILSHIHSGLNRYIIVSKKPLHEIMCSVHETYNIIPPRLIENVFTLRHTDWDNESFHIGSFDVFNNVVVYPFSVTEDEVYSLIFPDATMCDSVEDFIEEMKSADDEGTLFISSGSTLGTYLNDFLNSKKNNGLWLPESFEWLVLTAIRRLFKFTYDVKDIARSESDGNWYTFFYDYLTKLVRDTLHLYPYDRQDIPQWLCEGRILDSISNIVHSAKQGKELR